MKVAIVHDYLNQRGGAERVVAVLHQMYPEAPIYTLFVDRNQLWPALDGADIRPSVLQRFPFIMKHFKLFFWLYPLAIRTLSVQACDVVISSSSAYAKGVRVPKHAKRHALHVCYCHTPMRFAWDFGRYIQNETRHRLLAVVASLFLAALKRWDVRTARTVDVFVANSTAVRDRVWRFYRREAVVIHPPVRVVTEAKQLEVEAPQQDYYLVVSRLVAYKSIDLVIRACNTMGLPLVIIGTGPDRARLQALAGPTVEFLGFQSDEEVRRRMRACKALVFPGEEDFGISPVEANAEGRPVVALARGGALDTIEDGINGVLFDELTEASLSKGLERLASIVWEPDRIRSLASRFDTEVFCETLSALVRDLCQQRLGSSSTNVTALERGVYQ